MTEVLLPPLVPASVIFADGYSDGMFFGRREMVLVYLSLFVAGIAPSTVYTLAIEFAFSRGLDAKTKRALSVSGSIGAFIGFVCALIFWTLTGDSPWVGGTSLVSDILLFGALGLCSCLAAALAVRGFEIRAHKSRQSPPSRQARP